MSFSASRATVANSLTKLIRPIVMLTLPNPSLICRRPSELLYQVSVAEAGRRISVSGRLTSGCNVPLLWFGVEPTFATRETSVAWLE